MQSTSQPHQTAAERPLPGGDFQLFLTRLGLQAMIALGLVENPITGRSEQNLASGIALLADLEMLRDKTRGNLEADEEQKLEEILSSLRACVERTNRGASS